MLDGTHPGLPKGEHAADFMARTRRAFSLIADRHPEGHVLVVGHGLALGAWLSTIHPEGLVALPNASVSEVEVEPDGSARVLRIGVDVAGQGLVAARPVPPREDALPQAV